MLQTCLKMCHMRDILPSQNPFSIETTCIKCTVKMRFFSIGKGFCPAEYPLYDVRYFLNVSPLLLETSLLFIGKLYPFLFLFLSYL